MHAETQRRNEDERHSSLEKYTSHFIWKGCVWEGVGDRTELQHIDPHSIGHYSVSFLFSRAAQLIWSRTATDQSGAWGPTLLDVGFLYYILSSTDWTSCAPSYIIVRNPPSSCGRHKSHSFNPSTVKVIFWFSSTGCTCHLHRGISYFDSPAGSEVNMQHFLYNFIYIYLFSCSEKGFYSVVGYQRFQPHRYDFHMVVWVQVFLSNINIYTVSNSYIYVIIVIHFHTGS